MIYTSYFVPGDRVDVKFVKKLQNSISRQPPQHVGLESTISGPIEAGFYDGLLQNVQYSQLVETSGAVKLNRDSIIRSLSVHAGLNRDSGPADEHVEPATSLQINIIFGHFYCGKSVDCISDELGIAEQEVLRTVRRFKESLQQRLKSNTRHLGKSKILNQNHLKFIKDCTESSFASPLTVNEIRAKLLNTFINLQNLSNSTISRCLKNQLNMCYKKITKINEKLNSPGQALRIGRCKWCINYLEEEGYEVIFIDEFSYAERKQKLKGWSRKEKKKCALENKGNFCINFIVALSARRYYSVLGMKKACTSQIFSSYLEYLQGYCDKIGEVSGRVVMVCDNATIHRSQHTKECLKDLGIRMLTIPPYSPWLNPAEQYIGAFKKKINKFKR